YPLQYQSRKFLLNPAFDLEAIDFLSSSLYSLKPTSGEGALDFLPRHWKEQPTSRKLKRFRKALARTRRFIGQITKQCWLSQLNSATDVQTANQAIISRTVKINFIPHLDGLDTTQDM
ncbi:hypothetical protein N7495_005796, partial [Penicillium taxi]|uniref:uncharacterized protein n=1 Tax=Penicillium taxi TaxID=168475 RepID=UPI002544EDF0